jgi:hypothetical protein
MCQNGRGWCLSAESSTNCREVGSRFAVMRSVLTSLRIRFFELDPFPWRRHYGTTNAMAFSIGKT